MGTPTFEQFVASFVAGESGAAAEVFERFQTRMIQLARRRITDPRLQAKFDPEDVAQSAFLTFWRRSREGEFELTDWDSFWHLLSKITQRRCHKYWKLYQQTNKRALDRETSSTETKSAIPDPVQSAIAADLLDRLSQQLDKNSQATLALKLEGCTETEICNALKCSVRSVRRRVAHIREVMEAVDE